MFKFNVMSKQKGDIRTTLSEWWKIQLQNVQTIEKILTEFSGGYCFFQVFVGSGDDTDVDGDDRIISQTDNLFFLQDTKQTTLQFWGDIADLIEKNSSLVSHFKETHLSAFGSTCKSTFHITK